MSTSTPPSDAEMFRLANDLRIACQRIARRVRMESTIGVAPHQFTVLTRVRNEGPQTPTHLAAGERVSLPSMTRTVNYLVEQGYAARMPHPEDRRQVLVHLTDAGEDLIQQTIAQRDSWMRAHIEGLDDEQLRLLRQAADLLLEVSCV